MNSSRKNAVIVGVLYITATVAYSLAMIILNPILSDSNYLAKASEHGNHVILGAFLVLVDSVAVAGIGVMMYSILKKRTEDFALGYAGARIVECVLFAINAIAILTLLKLSQEAANAGVSDASFSQILGVVIMAAGNWAYMLGLGLAFALSALILNSVLFQSRFVPRWLSGWGFVGAVLVLVNFLLESFGNGPVEILYYPIAVQEMVFAIWLIIKGFNLSAINRGEL